MRVVLVLLLLASLAEAAQQPFCNATAQPAVENVTDCTLGYFPCSDTTTGSLLLTVFYGALLGLGATWISDGAEGILELWPKYGSVIGALMLPVLGALPDSAMVIMSGALGTYEDALVQLSVGVGTLAGSTVVLLTLPWSACLFVGGCDLDDNNEAIEKRRTSWNIFRVGVTVDDDTRLNARIMLISSAAFFVVQGIAFKYALNPIQGEGAEHPFALAGFVVCSVGLVAYCIYQLAVPALARKRLEKLQQEREDRNVQLRAVYVCHHFPEFQRIVSPALALETTRAKALHFARVWKSHALDAPMPLQRSVNGEKEDSPLLLVEPQSQDLGASDDDDEAEAPEEDPRQNFGKNLLKALGLLLAGTVIVGVFSDPMVDVISKLGNLWGIPIFFISFVLTPFCSNASEIIASIAFAAKKKMENTSMTYSQLYGAVVMNNTMVLGIFFAIIAFRGLPWTYSAEVITIFVVILAVGIPAAILKTFRLFWVFFNAPLYPLSILLVYLLQNYAFTDCV